MQKMTRESMFYMFVGTFPQLLASLAATISSISDGMQYGWSAPAIPILQSDHTPVKISQSDVSGLETIFMAGSICSLPVTIYLVDKVGRKYSIIAATLISLLSWILTAVASTVAVLYVSRFCAGVAADVAFISAPMYIAEIADRKIRGFLAAFINALMYIGILIIYSVAPFVPFYVPSIIGGTILVLQLVVFPFMPESPHFLVTKGKLEDAKAALQRLYPTGNVEEELDDIKGVLERQRSEKRRPLDLVLVRSNRLALIIVTVLNTAQHFCGTSVTLMNVHTILKEADSVYMESTTSAIIFAGIMLVSATISSLYVDRYGRRPLLFASSFLTGITMLALTVYFQLQHENINVKGISWLPVVCVMAYAAVFKFGLGVIPMVLTAELFPATVKALGMTLADAIYIVSGLVSLQVYNWLHDYYGIHVPFYVFTVCSFSLAVFTILVVPETKGRSLEEVQQILKGQPLHQVKKEESEKNGG